MTGIVLVTHDGIGECLLRQAETIMGHAVPATTVAISYDADPDQALGAIETALAMADTGNGLLILTDLPGATPHNLAHRAIGGREHKLVSGVNLPMLLKVLNYADLTPGALAEKAWHGGRNSMTLEHPHRGGRP